MDCRVELFVQNQLPFANLLILLLLFFLKLQESFPHEFPLFHQHCSLRPILCQVSFRLCIKLIYTPS